MKLSLRKKAKVKGKVAGVGYVSCSTPCGRIKLVARKGRKAVGRRTLTNVGTKQKLKLRLTTTGKRHLRKSRRLTVKLDVRVTPAGQPATRQIRRVLLKARS